MSPPRKTYIWGLGLVAALGWITASVVIFDRSWAETKFASASRALVQSHVERRALSQELEHMTAQFDAAQQRMSALNEQIAKSKARLTGLPDHVQRELLAGAPAKYVTITRAKLRSGPSSQSQELAIISSETPIEVLGIAPDGQWLEVGKIGYIHNDLLRPAP